MTQDTSTTTTVWNIQANISGDGWFNLINDQGLTSYAYARERLAWWRKDMDPEQIRFRIEVVNTCTTVTHRVVREIP